MRVILSLALAVLIGFAFVCVPTPKEAAGATLSELLAKKTRTSVTGTGKTKFEAENEARSAANQIVAGTGGNYRTVSKKTTGSGMSFTCTMVIEYDDK